MQQYVYDWTAYVPSGEYDEGDLVENAGTLIVEAGGEVVATNVQGILDVSGGVAYDTHVIGGTMNVGFGGSDHYTDVSEGGVLNVNNNGTSWYATVYSGSEHVANGGTSWYATIDGGTMTVDHGGFACGTTINGCNEYVSGLDAYATLTGQSMQLIEAGGVSAFAHAESYSGLLVDTGGSAIGATLDKNCWMLVAGGGKANDTNFNGPNATVTFQDWHDSVGTTVMGFWTKDEIDFRGMFAGPGTTLTCTENAQNTAAVLTLKDAMGQTTSLTLMGQYSGAEFSTQSDGHGGIAVTQTGALLLGPVAAHFI